MFILFEPLQLKAILEDYARIYIFVNKQKYRFYIQIRFLLFFEFFMQSLVVTIRFIVFEHFLHSIEISAHFL